MTRSRRMSTGLRATNLIGVTCLLYFLKGMFARSGPYRFSEAVRSCPTFTSPMRNNTSTATRPVPKLISHMLSFVDHIYIISLHSCSLALPESLFSRTTCVHGKVLDSCAPREYLQGRQRGSHALKVTFTHAVTMQLAMNAGYSNVAIIEDDLEFISGRTEKFSKLVVSQFAALLHSKSWAIIRFGFRPYFLQTAGSKPCPKNCRCRISSKYGFHLCELRQHGCDMRSSDFYIIDANYIPIFQHAMLDRTRSNEDRIVDAYPMRSIRKQWFFIPQVSFQRVLDIPIDYQVGSGSLFIKKCVIPRPIPPSIAEQAILG